ncbi:MAG: hypothetical protein JSS04_23625 [Proteobacteria bacterium]|nr:hypothetical protein [Pseudomonadota bacterium]
MMRFAIVVLAGALAAACTIQESRTVVPAPRVDDACSAYGYAPGTQAHRICAEREAAARARGRMAAGYAATRLEADAQEACLSYGLSRGTSRFDRCVRREIDYRRPI